VDCPEILRRCRDDGVEAAVLLPNCPVSDSAAWKLDYRNVEKLAADEIRRRRDEWDLASVEAPLIRLVRRDPISAQSKEGLCEE
jgi:hypothetical protein